MRKFFCVLAVLVLGCSSIIAQEDDSDFKSSFNISVQGGTLFSVSENSWSYVKFDHTAHLFKGQFAGNIGYDFTPAFGIRGQVGWGMNAGGNNVNETLPRGFWPYKFKSINYFVDGLLNLNGIGGIPCKFAPKLYVGLGGAHTYDFVQDLKIEGARPHPWQWDDRYTQKKNDCFGFRVGFIAQYDFTKYFGIYADLCGEAYMDNYDGLRPFIWEQERTPAGYRSLPFDLRGTASIGVIFHIY